MEDNETKPVEGQEQGDNIDALKAELERLKIENGKLKSAQSNASADASKYKKQLQERMTEQEKEELACVYAALILADEGIKIDVCFIFA